MIEDDLRNLRLVAGADELRERVLTAAGLAVKDRRVGRWIHAIAAVAVISVALTVALADRSDPRRGGSAVESDHRPRYMDIHRLLKEDGS